MVLNRHFTGKPAVDDSHWVCKQMAELKPTSSQRPGRVRVGVADGPTMMTLVGVLVGVVGVSWVAVGTRGVLVVAWVGAGVRDGGRVAVGVSGGQ